MYLTFSKLNSIHWLIIMINKKDIGLNVLFRTFHDNFQVKLFPPKIFIFLISILLFVKYMLMYLTFSNLNSIHWLIIKKKCTFQDIFRSNYFHLKLSFFIFFEIFVTYMLMYLRFSNLNSIHWKIKKI